MTARTVYQVSDVAEGESLFFETLAPAKVAAQEQADAQGFAIEVWRLTVSEELKGRALLVALLSGQGWASENVTVWTAQPAQEAGA